MPQGSRAKKQAQRKGPSKAKAGEMLRDGKVRGKPLTRKQKGFFGAIRGG